MTTKKKPQVAIGQVNLSKGEKVTLQEGGPEGSLFRRSLVLFEGDFMGMFGPITVTPELMGVMAERFNREFESPKNEHDYPPLLVDHDARADNVMGRILPPLVVTEWQNPRTNETVQAMFADIRVDDVEAQDKVQKGKYSHLSISFDDDINNLGEIFELSFVGVEAARGAQVLKQGDDSMNELEKLTKKYTSLKIKNGNSKLARIASYASLVQNIEGVKTQAKELSEKIKTGLISLKTNALKSQLANFVREGKLSKAEFEKIDMTKVLGMNSDSQKIYLSSFANRPVSTDLVQHGMTGAEPLDGNATKLSAKELRKAIKAQKTGEEYKGQSLASDDDKSKEEREQASKAQKTDDEPEVKTDLTLDDIDDALSKLEGLSSLADKIEEAGERMKDTLSKLRGDDENDDEKEGE